MIITLPLMRWRFHFCGWDHGLAVSRRAMHAGGKAYRLWDRIF